MGGGGYNIIFIATSHLIFPVLYKVIKAKVGGYVYK